MFCTTAKAVAISERVSEIDGLKEKKESVCVSSRTGRMRSSASHDVNTHTHTHTHTHSPTLHVLNKLRIELYINKLLLKTQPEYPYLIDQAEVSWFGVVK